VIHRRILDLADDMPEASLETVADEVSGATPELVERVLTEHGDPSSEASSEPVDEDDTDADPTEPADTGDGNADPTKPVDTGNGNADPTKPVDTGNGNADPATGIGGRRDATELSKKQRETLELVARNPDATQRELAAELGVTAATISRWVNDIPGFDWSDRNAFVAGVLDDGVDDTAASDGGASDAAGPEGDAGDTAGPEGGADDASGTNHDVAAGADGTRDDSPGSDSGVPGDQSAPAPGDPGDQPAPAAGDSDPTSEDALEAESGGAAAGEVGGERDDAGPDRIDTELLHKVVHACMASERTTEEEEIRLLDHLLG
jgi:transcriptional regulator with XRE-family HTH domain